MESILGHPEALDAQQKTMVLASGLPSPVHEFLSDLHQQLSRLQRFMSQNYSEPAGKSVSNLSVDLSLLKQL